AAQQGNVSVLKVFIESNRANARDRDGENLTALHYAALSGRPAACRFLIEQGARVNTRGGDIDATSLQFAACYGYLNIIHLLISYGADPDV
ncbi:ankyrin repeat-containing domain protein, partial [Abortiporus biennis]